MEGEKSRPIGRMMNCDGKEEDGYHSIYRCWMAFISQIESNVSGDPAAPRSRLMAALRSHQLPDFFLFKSSQRLLNLLDIFTCCCHSIDPASFSSLFLRQRPQNRRSSWTPQETFVILSRRSTRDKFLLSEPIIRICSICLSVGVCCLFCCSLKEGRKPILGSAMNGQSGKTPPVIVITGKSSMSRDPAHK